jgi:hypothetical protein
MDKIGGGLHEAVDGAVAGIFGGGRDFGELRKVRNVSAGSDPIEMLFEEVGAQFIEFFERHAPWLGRGSVMDQHHRLRFDLEAAMAGQVVEEVDPVSEAIFIRGTAGPRMGDKAKRNTALLIIVHGAETDLVIALIDGPVVDEFGGVHKVEAVHATTS